MSNLDNRLIYNLKELQFNLVNIKSMDIQNKDLV